MSTKKFSAIVLVVLLSANHARGDCTVSWDTGYPAPGSPSGSIYVQGTFVLDSSSVYSQDVASIWQDGGLVQTFTVTPVPVQGSSPPAFTWSTTCSGLTANVSYSVVVDLTYYNYTLMTSQTVRSDPVTSLSQK